MKTKTLTKNLVIAIILATVCIASFALSLMHFNASAETMYLVNYVDNAGRLIKTETTSLGNLSGADKEGFTTTYSVLAFAGLPFFEIDCNPEEKLTYPEVSYGYEMWGNNLEELLKYYTDSNNEVEEKYDNAQIEYFKKYGHNAFVGIKNDYGLEIEFFFPATDLETRNESSHNTLPHDYTFLINGEEIDFRTNYTEHSLVNGAYHFPSSVESEWNTAKPYDIVSLQLTKSVETVKLIEFNGITEENFETKIDSLSEVTEAHTNKGEIYIKVAYEENISTPNEPTTDGDNKPTTDKPNAFVSFFKDNTNTLKTQFTALGNADFNTALTTGWQIYAVLGSGLIVLIAIITSILSALRPRKRRRR